MSVSGPEATSSPQMQRVASAISSDDSVFSGTFLGTHAWENVSEIGVTVDTCYHINTQFDLGGRNKENVEAFQENKTCDFYIHKNYERTYLKRCVRRIIVTLEE